MNSNWYKILLKIMNVKIEKKLLLKGTPIIINNKGASMEIGENVTIKSSFLSNLVGLYSRTIIVTRNKEAKIKIGNNVGISGATIYARNSIEIGDNTLIGGNSKILDNDFHPLEIEERNNDNKDKILSKPIKIGKNCFIGCNSIILKGTELGEGCIVGAGAVVSGKFDNNSIIVGNPAKIIRKIGE